MSRTLLLFPSSIENAGLPGEHEECIQNLCSGAHSVFYYDSMNVLELKKLIIQNAYDTIIIGFPSLDGAIPEMSVIKSLSLGSTCIIYCPDVAPLRADGCMKTNRKGDIFKWHVLGKSILLNLCRQADMVVARCEDDERLLYPAIGDVPLMNIKQLREAHRPAIEKKKINKVSIIMLTFNQLADTRQSVESLQKYTPVDYELIFVDNGSVDDTREYLEGLKKTHGNVRIIYNQHNVGFAKANNQGMRIAVGEYILLLNNDVVLTEGWLERLLICIDSDTGVGIAGPCTNHAVGQQVINPELECDADHIQKYACLNAISSAGSWFETHRIIGFCMLIKREVIDRVGMLDEQFGPGGFEDYDFCLRVKQGGYKILIAGDVFIYHLGGRGYSNNNLDYSKLRQRNVQIFIEKWCRKALEVMEAIPF